MNGGIIRPDVVSKHVVPNIVNVTWAWNNESQGLVQWTFSNTSPEQQSVILLRNNYYFGNAFWPVYVNNPEFNTSFATGLVPLVDNGVNNNSPPLGVVNFGSNSIVCFVFTLSAGQTWSMLEGGFSSLMQPMLQSAPVVTLSNSGTYCIGYSEQQVVAWDTQTSTSLQGYSPNPSEFTTVSVSCNGPFIALYNDPISSGACTGGGSGNSCLAEIEDGLALLLSGDNTGIIEIEDGIMCLISNLNIPLVKMFSRSLIKRIEKLL